MALNSNELVKAQEALEKSKELQNLIRDSLSIQAVGGSHVSNELTSVIDALQAFIDNATSATPV